MGEEIRPQELAMEGAIAEATTQADKELSEAQRATQAAGQLAAATAARVASAPTLPGVIAQATGMTPDQIAQSAAAPAEKHEGVQAEVVNLPATQAAQMAPAQVSAAATQGVESQATQNVAAAAPFGREVLPQPGAKMAVPQAAENAAHNAAEFAAAKTAENAAHNAAEN